MDEMKVLDLLSLYPRASVTDLADILGEKEEDVEKAKKNLEEKKIICGYHTVINWDKTNIDHVDAFIGISAKPERDRGYDKIAERIYQYNEVDSVYLMSGAFDFTVFISGRTMREVALFVAEKLSPLDSVVSTATHFVLKKYKDHGTILAEKAQDERQLISL